MSGKIIVVSTTAQTWVRVPEGLTHEQLEDMKRAIMATLCEAQGLEDSTLELKATHVISVAEACPALPLDRVSETIEVNVTIK